MKPAATRQVGMSSNPVITGDDRGRAWILLQALPGDGRTFVYLQSAKGFMPHDVKLERRSESQAVLSGIKEGEVVAMSNPDQATKTPGGEQNSAMKALSK
jgi:hypothetical protein